MFISYCLCKAVMRWNQIIQKCFSRLFSQIQLFYIIYLTNYFTYLPDQLFHLFKCTTIVPILHVIIVLPVSLFHAFYLTKYFTYLTRKTNFDAYLYCTYFTSTTIAHTVYFTYFTLQFIILKSHHFSPFIKVLDIIYGHQAKKKKTHQNNHPAFNVILYTPICVKYNVLLLGTSHRRRCQLIRKPNDGLKPTCL